MDTRELEKELLAGLEGVTPGPYSTGGDDEHGRESGCLIWGPKGPGHGTVGAVKPYNNYTDHIKECQRQAAHFARCSPDNIRALLRALADERALLKDAEEALENANGFLNTPISRRRNAGDSFYSETVQSVAATLAKIKEATDAKR